MGRYQSHVIKCFIWDLQETSQRRTNGTSKIRTIETSWWRTAEMSLGVSIETCLRHWRDAMMGRCCCVLLRRCHDVPIRCCGDVHWDVLATFHRDVVGCFIWDVPVTSLGRTERRRYDVATTSCYRVGPCLKFSLWDFSKQKSDWIENKITTSHWCFWNILISCKKWLKEFMNNFICIIIKQNFILLLFECITHPSSTSFGEIKLIAIANWIFHVSDS